MIRRKIDKNYVLSVIPINKRVADGCNAEGSQVVPAEAHGDEHDVCIILLVPFGGSKRWEQHKPNLVDYTENRPPLMHPEMQPNFLPVATKVIHVFTTTSYFPYLC